jgi:PAS domain S-box-containing protein
MMTNTHKEYENLSRDAMLHVSTQHPISTSEHSEDDELILADEDDELTLADEDDELTLADDLTLAPDTYSENGATWKVMIADDERDVHEMTHLALEDFVFQGQPITFFSAYSGKESKALLKEHPDIALIFLDVVMEDNDAGLQVAKYIRETLHNHLIRIILRTGQPGEAPEESVIVDYDINDYKLKLELTRRKLFVTTIAGLRSYRDLIILEKHKADLKQKNVQLEAEIAERKRAEEKLRITQFSVDKAGHAVYWINEKAQIVYANEAAQRALGYSLDELLSMTIHDIDPKFPPEAWTPHWNHLKQCGCLRLESHHQTKQGDIFPIEITANYRVFNRIEYNFAFVHDITERKRAEKERIRFTQQLSELNQAYERFIPHQFLELLDKQSIVDIQLGDQIEKDMTILFSDVRGFTSLSEKMTPPENFQFINTYLGQMEPIILEHRGIIDKYIGDAIMALFFSADEALQGAIAMLKQLTHYNQERQTNHLPSISIGIGLNSGQLMLGTVGGKNRMDGTVISDAVNLASRVEGLTKKYQTPLLITEHTHRKLAEPEQYQIRVVDAVKVKGKLEVITIYEIYDVDTPLNQELKNQTREDFATGFVLYHSGEIIDAQIYFEKILQIHETDKVAQTYLKRCQYLQKYGIHDED